MKYIIYTLMLSSLLSYAQIDINQNTFVNKEIEICLEIKEKMDLQNSRFKTEYSYDEIFDRILSVIGINRNFELVECNNINNAVAYTRFEENIGYVRYIAYDDNFMGRIEKNSNDWAKIGILAHEIGHHLNFHNLTYIDNLADKRSQEIESDEFAGFVLQKLGATLNDAKLFIKVSNDEIDDTNSTHPKRSSRLKAIERGYTNAKNGETIKKTKDKSISDESETPVEPPSITSELGVYTTNEIGEDLRNGITARTKYDNKIITVKAQVFSLDLERDYKSNKEMKVIRTSDLDDGRLRSLRGSFNCYFNKNSNLSDVKPNDVVYITGKAKIENGRISLFDCTLKH
ncbi:M48 family metalloprotease [Ulvibacter antarcticus]|nr:hypothetical protein [Ulvibacter antarcticus]